MQQPLPFTVLKRYGIKKVEYRTILVATALTVYGIETFLTHESQQTTRQLQQPLPFTVLKLAEAEENAAKKSNSCNSPYRLRY